MPRFLPSPRPRPRLRCVLPLISAMAGLPAILGADFVDVTPPALENPGASFGVAWADYDEDGDPDLFVSQGEGTNHLYRNDGGMFVEVTPPALTGTGAGFGAAWGDADGDGDPDLYLAVGTGPNRLFRNEGGDLFTDITSGPEGASDPGQGAAWADVDGDGDLDLYATFWEAPNRLLRNDDGVFVDVTASPLDFSGKSQGAAWGDYDNDGDPDLYLGTWLGSRLFRNDGGGTFTDVTVPPLDKTGVTGVAWGDYDNDGDLDLYLGREVLFNRLLRNDGAVPLTFTDEYIPAIHDTLRTQSVVFFDYDNDGDLDLLGVNTGARNDTGASNRLMQNVFWSLIGPGTTAGRGAPRAGLEIASPGTHDTWVIASSGPILDVERSRGAGVADYDGDGDLDIHVVNWFSGDQLLRNDGAGGNHWLHVRLDGGGGNRAGIGARVRVVTGPQAQIREINGGSGLYSQNDPVAAFGLGVMAAVDTLEVRWPTGEVTRLTGVAPVDRVLTVFRNPTAVPGEEPPVLGVRLGASPNPARRRVALVYELDRTAPVSLEVFDLKGRRVGVLVRSGAVPPGSHRVDWEGLGMQGEPVSPGIYFFRLRAGSETVTRKVALIR